MATATLVDGVAGVALGIALFTSLVAALVATGARGEPAIATRWSTALVSAVISPVLAILLARMVHPTQRLARTSIVAVSAYGFTFWLAYLTLGAGADAALGRWVRQPDRPHVAATAHGAPGGRRPGAVRRSPAG